MTARSLFKSLPARNTMLSVGQNKKFFIIICILQTLGLPLVMAALMLELWEDALSEAGRLVDLPSMELYAAVGVFCLSVSVILGIPAAIASFPELWKKSRVDMIYALPLSGRQRYFSHYFTGFTLYIIPYIAAMVLGWLILLAGCAAIAPVSPDMGWPELGSEVIQPYFIGSFGLLFLMWMYYTAAVLFISCCGTLFESIYTNILFNLLVPGTLAALIAVMISQTSTMEFNWYGIEWTSPLGGLIYLFYLMTDMPESLFSYSGSYYIAGSEAASHNIWAAYFLWLLKIVLVTAVLLAAAWQLYIRRKAEEVSKPFPYKALYFVMLTMITVLILCLVNVDDDLIGPALLFSGIVYLVMEVIRKRGFKKFWVSVISYVGTAAAVLVMMFLVNLTHCFHQEYRIPSVSSISSVEVSANSWDGAGVDLEFVNQDVIRAVHDLQKEVIEDYKNSGSTTMAIDEKIFDSGCLMPSGSADGVDYYSDPFAVYAEDTVEYGWDEDIYTGETVQKRMDKEEYAFGNYAASCYDVSITYYTILGGTVIRNYEMNFDQYQQLLAIMEETDLYAGASADRILTQCLINYEPNKRKLEFPVISASGVRQILSPVNAGEKEAQALRDAYYADIQERTAAEIRTSGIYCYIRSDIPVYNFCENTIEVLRSLGMKEFTVSEQYDLTDMDNRESDSENAYSETMEVRLYEPGDYITDSQKYTAIGGHRETYVKPYEEYFLTNYYLSSNTSIESRYPELYAVLKAAKGDGCISDKEGCWMVWINGGWYYLEPEDAELAQALKEAGNDPEDYWIDRNDEGFGGAGGGMLF